MKRFLVSARIELRETFPVVSSARAQSLFSLQAAALKRWRGRSWIENLRAHLKKYHCDELCLIWIDYFMKPEAPPKDVCSWIPQLKDMHHPFESEVPKPDKTNSTVASGPFSISSPRLNRAISPSVPEHLD
jgi:hypothetical protein